jgi:hypothetical protein
MNLTKGEALALYLLLSSQSRLAGVVAGTLTASGDQPSSGNPPLGPAGTPALGLARFNGLAAEIGIPAAHLTASQTKLLTMFTPNGTVSNDFHVLRTALSLDDDYGDSGPCPTGDDESNIVLGLQKTIDGD